MNIIEPDVKYVLKRYSSIAYLSSIYRCPFRFLEALTWMVLELFVVHVG